MIRKATDPSTRRARRNFRQLRAYADAVIYYRIRYEDSRISDGRIAAMALSDAAYFAEEAFGFARGLHTGRTLGRR